MKKTLLISLVLLIFLASCKDRPNITIEGKIHSGAKEMLYLDFLDINKTRAVDSLRIRKDDSFRFSFFSEYPGIYILRNSDGKIINLLPFPGEKLILNADYERFSSGYTVAGSEESEYIRQLVEKLQDTRAKIRKLNSSYQSLSNVTEEQASGYIQQLKAITKEQRDFSIQFIIEHLNSIASIYALYQEISDGQYVLGENLDLQYMKIVADSVSRYYPDVPFVASFVADARNSEEKFNNLRLLHEKIMEADSLELDIFLPDAKNDSISLSSLEGKTVLVYFWSTRSPDSRNLNPRLKTIYDKYRSRGFEVYAVAIDNNKKAWMDAIRYDELDWINVLELGFPESRTAALYNVKVLPSTFLYNSKGEIVARDIFGSELEKWLENIL